MQHSRQLTGTGELAEAPQRAHQQGVAVSLPVSGFCGTQRLRGAGNVLYHDGGAQIQHINKLADGDINLRAGGGRNDPGNGAVRIALRLADAVSRGVAVGRGCRGVRSTAAQ